MTIWTRSAGPPRARYGVVLDASLITGIDPPAEVESALAAINAAHNRVLERYQSRAGSVIKKIVQSKRAVEIETLKAQAEVQPIKLLAEQLAQLRQAGPAESSGLHPQREIEDSTRRPKSPTSMYRGRLHAELH